MSKRSPIVIVVALVAIAVSAYFFFISREGKNKVGDKIVGTTPVDPTKINGKSSEKDGGSDHASDSARKSQMQSKSDTTGREPTDNLSRPSIEDYLISRNTGEVGQAMNSEMNKAALTSKEFSDIVQKVSDKASQDRDLQELSTKYRDAISAQLSNSGANIENFACGLQFCIGEINVGQDQSRWQAWKNVFDNDSRTPYSTFSEYQLKDDFGNFQYRFIFSTDPNVNAIQVPAN